MIQPRVLCAMKLGQATAKHRWATKSRSRRWSSNICEVISHVRNCLTFCTLLVTKANMMVYVPTNFETGKCYQYAFVNFISEDIAQQFQMQLQGCADESFFGEQHCEVSWSDCQGLPDIIEKYRNSPMMHPSVPDECKPMLFVDGRAAPFPAPTRKISKPRTNRRSR